MEGDFYFKLGNIFVKFGRINDVIKSYFRVINFKLNYIEVYSNLVNILGK